MPTKFAITFVRGLPAAAPPAPKVVSAWSKPLAVSPEAEVDGINATWRREIETYRTGKRERRKAIQIDLEGALGNASNTEAAKKAAIRKYEVDYQGCPKSWEDVRPTLKATAEQRLGHNGKPIFLFVQMPLASTPALEPIQGIPFEAVGIGVKRVADEAAPAPTYGAPTLLAQVFLGDTRFKPLTPLRMLHGAQQYPVYAHRQTAVQFVQDDSHRFLRRWQWRAVNDGDAANLRARRDLNAPIGRAHPDQDRVTFKEHESFNVPQGRTIADRKEKILYHVQTGNNRFISITSTKHNVYSNSPSSFIGPNGWIILDLSMIPPGDIVDLHTRSAAQDHLNMNPDLFDQSFGFGDKTAAQRAARDVVRTRETLIFGSVPIAAVAYWSEDATPPTFAFADTSCPSLA